MKALIEVRKFDNSYYEIDIGGLKRLCPLYRTDHDIWIVGNEHLSFGTDVEFTQEIGKRLAEKLERFKANCILAPETKSLGVAYEVAKHLGHRDFAIARKSIKPYNINYFSVSINSITSAKDESLFLDEINIDRIKGKRLILLDDVISTGSTMCGLMELANKAGGDVCAIAAIWVEGFLPFKLFAEEFKSKKIVFLSVLPLFADGEKLEELLEKKVLIENEMSCYGIE